MTKAISTPCRFKAKKVFLIQGYDAAGNYVQLATRFYTQKGVRYLRPGSFYRSLHH